MTTHYDITGPIGPVKLELTKCLVAQLTRNGGCKVYVNAPLKPDWQLSNIGRESDAEVIIDVCSGIKAPLQVFKANKVGGRYAPVNLTKILSREALAGLYDAFGAQGHNIPAPKRRGRPPTRTEPYCAPVTWRPASAAVYAEFLKKGGSKWLNKALKDSIDGL